MVKIVCYARKEKYMKKITEAIKFVAACLLASAMFALTIISCIGCIIPCCARILHEMVYWLSPDVGNMLYEVWDNLELKLLSAINAIDD